MDSSAGASDPLASVDADLASLDATDPAEHVQVFSRIHTALTTALAGTTDSSSPSPQDR